MFMQAGFAFLEAGLTRMKNVGHVAAKNVLIFAICSIVYYLVGYGLAFGDGGSGFVGGSGFAPSVDDLLAIGAAPFSWFSTIPQARATSSRSSLLGLHSQSSGERWQSGRSCGCTSSSASSSRSSTPLCPTGSGLRTAGCSIVGCRTSLARPSFTTREHWPRSLGRSSSERASGSSTRTASRTRFRVTTWPT